MPPFPGMGYPLVPGYESVGRVTQAGPSCGVKVGQTVFVPGARCYGEVHGLFGGAASRVVTPASRVIPISEGLKERGVLGHVISANQIRFVTHLDVSPEMIGQAVAIIEQL